MVKCPVPPSSLFRLHLSTSCYGGRDNPHISSFDAHDPLLSQKQLCTLLRLIPFMLFWAILISMLLLLYQIFNQEGAQLKSFNEGFPFSDFCFDLFGSGKP